MIFQDNVVKNYLSNVYFVTGTPCGGKSTISKAIGKKHGIMVFDIDARFEEHKALSDPKYQPNMNKSFKSADEFFGRSKSEYKQWLLENTREQLDFVLMDLIRLSQHEKVICDCHLTIEQAGIITVPQRVAFLIKDPVNLVDDYCNRKDHQGFSEYIHSTSDYECAKKNCNDVLYELNAERYDDIKNSQFFWLERDNNRTVEETVELVEKHFGWS